jgi:hypothetical protein
MTWQPIETAPHIEEQELLVCTYDGGSYYCDVVRWAAWAGDGGGWYNGDRSHDTDYYTHWMPLPAPPVPSGGDRKPDAACSVKD